MGTSFGDRLRAARAAKGYTQEELGALMEVSKQTISGWENNRELPSFDRLPRLREVLAISLDVLVCASGDAAVQDNAFGIAEQAATPYAAPAIVLTRDELRLLRRFRTYTERRQKALIVFMDDAGE